ncbi:hypothetical protein [Nocardia asiatica]|uniref:hypothetical protein n=1 Tax=Nocardia asiatica TaxID=209252 RepID=UPI002457E048|nr:hypothetical protein [Nocardia asiatica]
MDRKLWVVQRIPGGSEVHVHPLDDLIEHTPNDCVCGPETEPIPRSDGTYGWLITHHSLDGREHQEKQQ